MTHTGEIIKIDELKGSRNRGEAFKRVYFKLEDGKWVKMDLVPTFRNYKRWEDKLKVGIRLTCLRLKDDLTVDADSWPKVYKTKEEELKELCQDGVFG